MPRKLPAPSKTYEVLRDTREKKGHGWTFAASTACKGTTIQKLDTGDYTLVGYEDKLCVERKGSVREFAMNLMEKRFEAELERMKSFKFAVVILEFELEDIMRWPEGSGVPKYKWPRLRVTAQFLLSRLWELQIKYPNVQFIFAGLYGKEATSSLFKRVIASK